MTNFSDTFTYALIVTLFGMGIVFLVLILLQYMLKAMEIIFHREKKAVQEPAQVSAVKPAEPDEPQVNEAEEASDDQLAAVITAAVISCLGGNSNIAVRNIRRVEDLTPAWGKASRTEQMAVRF
ncbi:MAG TPA: OadG family protein [Bacillota bacterium]|nr:OadG family protein [Clostridiaceae bacterium]HNR04646.1 OadG family protein [Bacillota bacterium]HNT03617.1 OadG family protein [Bacillota bacterium]HPX70021.1 OadG family protein [Bacillota bacterium]HQO42401.1 OadG family protein [Bacillota bacterium]